MTSLLRYLGGCLLLAGLPASVALAQPQPVGLPVDPMPFFPERTGELAATSQIPAAYELFVPDTSVQILFNPARAVRAASSWGWVTYNRTPVQLYQNPYGTDHYNAQQIDGRTLAGAWLRRQQRGAWLLQAGLSIATQQDEHDQHTEQDESSVAELDRQQSTDFRENVAQRWGVRMRLSRSWEGQQGGGHALEAFGFVGSINQEHVNRRHSLRVRTQHSSRGDAYHHRSLSEIYSIREDEVRPLVLGIGYSRTTARSDWIMTLSYQQATNLSSARGTNASTSADSLFNAQGEVEHVQESIDQSRNRSHASMEPRTVVGSFYARHRMGWLQENDHVFVAAMGLGGWGSQSYHFEASELQFVQEDDSVLVDESTQVQEDGRDDLWSWNVQGGVGYGIEAAYGAVSLFSGPSLWAEYGRAAHIRGGGLANTPLR